MNDASHGQTEELPPFLALAVEARRPEILEQLQSSRFTRPEYVELALSGLPDISRVLTFVWPEPLGYPTRIGVDIVQVDDDILPAAIETSFELAESERVGPHPDELITITAMDESYMDEDSRPRSIKIGHAEWTLVPDGGVAREVRSLSTQTGAPLFSEVDTAEYCYRLVCPKCGRTRHAKRNSIHQVKYCWVCTGVSKARRRVRLHLSSRGTVRRRPPNRGQQVLRLRREGVSERGIAAQLGVHLRTVQRIIARYKV